MLARCLTITRVPATRQNQVRGSSQSHDAGARRWAAHNAKTAAIEASDTYARRHDQDSPDGQADESRDRQQHGDRAAAGRHPFAAAESKVHGEEVAEKRRQPGRDFDVAACPWHLVELRFQEVRQGNGASSLGEIEDEDEQAERSAQDAADVGGADVAAALLEDIDAAHASDEEAERYRADEVGGKDSQDCGEPVHGGIVFTRCDCLACHPKTPARYRRRRD